MLYWLIVLFIAILLGMLGGIPYLVSASSDLSVIVGIAIICVGLPILYKVGGKIYDEFNEKADSILDNSGDDMLRADSPGGGVRESSGGVCGSEGIPSGDE